MDSSQNVPHSKRDYYENVKYFFLKKITDMNKTLEVTFLIKVKCCNVVNSLHCVTVESFPTKQELELDCFGEKKQKREKKQTNKTKQISGGKKNTHFWQFLSQISLIITI